LYSYLVKKDIMKNNMTDLKIYVLNGIGLALNFTSIEIGLKIILSAIVIGYTIHKWVLMHRKEKNK
tara:strand:+ start:5156 stop:5353 length:198 start_codon:yes stop_codon:yes gene_type:complete